MDRFIAESRETVYGVDAPVYDASFCGLCKRKSHTDTCPYGLEEKRLEKLKRAQEEREMERRDRRGGRSRSRSRDRDRGREQKDKERLEIERKILEQREALAREDEERKLRDATDRARAAALAFGGGGIPMIGGPGAVPLVTPGLSGAANPIGMMMHSQTSPQAAHSHYMNPFHPLNQMGPSPEMMASMAQFTSMMDPMGGVGGGYSNQKETVPVPSGYAAHVQAMEDQRARSYADEMARRAEMERDEMERRAMMEREREEMDRREKTEAIEARLRAEMEARLHEEIEQKRKEMEMELMEKLAPREMRKLGGDFGAAMSAYGMTGSLSTSIPTSMPMNPYAGMTNTYQSQPSFNPYSQPSPYGIAPVGSNGMNASSSSSTSNPYSASTSMQPMQSMQQQQLPMNEMPEFMEIKRLVNDNADTLKNLAYARDQSLATHPVLVRVGTLGGGSIMTQLELSELRDELKDFLVMLQRRAQDGRAKPIEVKKEVKIERGGRNDRYRRDDDRRRRSRSRSRSYERRGDRRDDKRRGGGSGWEHGGRRDIPNEVKKEEVIDIEEVEVIVQVGGNKFRQLREKEAMGLKRDNIVVAQDLKSGKWSTAKVLKVQDKRIQLTVGNAIWKKEFNEVYTPI